MKMYVLISQRKCSYPGEHAPEVLECVDEYTMEVNPDLIEDKRNEAISSKDFVAVEIMTLHVEDDVIEQRLYPNRESVSASVIDDT